MQFKACKLISEINNTDFESALENLNIIKFEDRRTSNKAIKMFKIAHDDIPNYLHDMFTFKEQINTNSNITISLVSNNNVGFLKESLKKHKGISEGGSKLVIEIAEVLKQAKELIYPEVQCVIQNYTFKDLGNAYHLQTTVTTK